MKSQKPTKIETARFEEVQRFNSSPAIRWLLAGEVTLAHYQALLCEIYFYARESPQFFSALPSPARPAARIHKDFTKMLLQQRGSRRGSRLQREWH